MNKCPSCNQASETNNDVCEICDNNLEPQNSQKSTNDTIIILIGILIILCILFFAAFRKTFNTDPSDQVEQSHYYQGDSIFLDFGLTFEINSIGYDINNKLERSNRDMNLERITETSYDQESDRATIEFTINKNADLFGTETKRDVFIILDEIYQPEYEFSELLIVGTYDIPNQYKYETAILMLIFKRETLDKFNWDEPDYLINNIFDLADSAHFNTDF